MRRYALRDDQWDRIKDFLPGREGHVGGTAADNRLFVEAVLFRYRAGIPWRDLPERFGDWKIVHQRFSRWGEEWSFRTHLQAIGERPRQRIHDDRRHHCARSPAQRRRAKKNGAQAIGRSRGGLTTKIHVLVDALGNPVDLMITPGQAHDLACAEPLLDGADPDALIGDKAYDADPLIETLTRRQITPVIPPKANRKFPRVCDFALYCERNLVERFFNKLKHFRAIATRYDKLARNFLAGIELASAIILLN
ncbi:MAG: IS5 family transposase [Rhodoplanes sp.]